MNPSRTIYINLACRDLPRAKKFYAALGFGCDARYSGDQSACVVISQNIFVMLLSESHYRNFAPKPPCDPMTTSGVLLCLLCESRDEVDDLVRKALQAGGATYGEPQDLGFMYSHGFQDPDGYAWKLNHMYPEAVN